MRHEVIAASGTVGEWRGYTPRPICYLGLWEHQGWRIKTFGISADTPLPRQSLIEEAKAAAAECLDRGPAGYGVGWIIVHQARGLDAVLIDWWFDENIAQHHVYGRPDAAPGPLVYGWPAGAGFCVWELAVCGWERQAWIDTVLRCGGPTAENLERYLASVRDDNV
jgi:hypothetical protein